MKSHKTNTCITAIKNHSQKTKALFLTLLLFSNLSLFSNDTPFTCTEEGQYALRVEMPDDLFDVADVKNVAALTDRFSTVLSPIFAGLANICNEKQSELMEIVSSYSCALDAENLSDATELQNSQLALDNYAGKLEECGSQFKKELHLAYAKLTEDYKDEEAFSTGLKLSLDAFSKPFLDYFEAGKEGTIKIHDILTFCSSVQGQCWSSENTLFFENEADAETYSDLVDKLLDHVEKEKAIASNLLKGLM